MFIKIFLGYQQCQVFKMGKKVLRTISVLIFKVLISTLRTRTEMALETLGFSPFNHLTRLAA
jgi:hypothetical protein